MIQVQSENIRTNVMQNLKIKYIAWEILRIEIHGNT